MIRNKDKALISTDIAALNKYKAERNLIRKVSAMEEAISSMQKRIEYLEKIIIERKI